MDMYTLLYLKWINKDLAQETLLNVMWQPGWEGSLGENGCMFMYGRVACCSPESITTLLIGYQFSSVQFSCSVVSDSVTTWTAARQPSLSVFNPWSLLKLMSIELVMPSNHLILCHSLLLLPSILPSIKVFSNELVLHIR